MASKAESRSLEAKCSCGSIHLRFRVPSSLLPLSAYLCHCSICRYATGAPCIFHTKLPQGLLPEFIGASEEGNLTSHTSPGSQCSYEFCSTCGCHVGGVSLDRRQWTMATSIFTDQQSGCFKIDANVFTKSAKGGGIASMLTHMETRELRVWNPADDAPSAGLVESEAEKGKDGEDRLRAQCLCGGVSFTIPRPAKEVVEDSYLAHAVSPLDKKKWKASLDVCDDCRLATGTHVIGWAFVPLISCEPRIDVSLKIGTAKTYPSSEGVLRSFCGVCGATVFFSKKSRRPTDEQAIVDVATGILRAPEGVMAEDWLTWRSRIAFAPGGTTFDAEFGSALVKGMKAWTKEKYGHDVEFTVG